MTIREVLLDIGQALGVSLVAGFITQTVTARITKRMYREGENVIVEYEIPGLSREIVKKRAFLHALTTLPIVKPEKVEVEEIAKGPILKRYKVKVIGKTLKK